MKHILLMMAAVVVVGCGKKEPELRSETVITPSEAANKLFVESAKLISEARGKEISDLDGAIVDYEQALANIRKITNDYPSSDLAVKIVSEDAILTGESVADIKNRIDRLKGEKRAREMLASARRMISRTDKMSDEEAIKEYERAKDVLLAIIEEHPNSRVTKERLINGFVIASVKRMIAKRREAQREKLETKFARVKHMISLANKMSDEEAFRELERAKDALLAIIKEHPNFKDEIDVERTMQAINFRILIYEKEMMASIDIFRAKTSAQEAKFFSSITPGLPLSDLPRLAVPPLTDKKELILSCTAVSDADFKKIANFNQLRWLDVRRTKITDAGIKDIAKLQQLHLLNLGFTKITDAGIKDIAKLQQLRWLNVRRTKITDAGLKDIAKLQNLTELTLDDTQITDAGLKEVAKLQNLDDLSLNDTKITDAGLKEVVKMQNLTFLNLGSTKITDAGLKEVVKMQNLTFLYLDDTQITDAGLKELKKALPKCSINSDHPLTKEESAKAIESQIRSQLGKYTGELTKADLENVTGPFFFFKGLTDVTGLEKLTQLKELHLDISLKHYTVHQLTELLKGLERLTQLKTLYIRGNELTHVKGLEKLTQLKTLYIYGNKLTKAQIAELQKALPKCEIFSNPTK